MHSRHDPNGSSESVAQSLGTWIPASAAARITEVPAGTATARPSISNATVVVARRSGVAKSLSARAPLASISDLARRVLDKSRGLGAERELAAIEAEAQRA